MGVVRMYGCGLNLWVWLECIGVVRMYRCG